MAYGYGMAPRGNMTKNQRLAAMLMQQERAAGPVRSHSQGIAQMLRAAMGGYARGQDANQQQAAQEGLMKGYAAKPWVNPDTGDATIALEGTGATEQVPVTPGILNNMFDDGQVMAEKTVTPPTMVSTGPAGGLEGMIASQQGMADNPYARRNLAQLLQTKMVQDYKSGLAKTAREQMLEDEKRKALSASGVRKEKRNYDEGLVQKEKEAVWERNRRTIKRMPALDGMLDTGPTPGDAALGGGTGQDILGAPTLPADMFGGGTGSDILDMPPTGLSGSGLDSTDLIGGAGDMQPGGSPFASMPIEALQYLSGGEDKGLAAMAKGELDKRSKSTPAASYNWAVPTTGPRTGKPGRYLNREIAKQQMSPYKAPPSTVVKMPPKISETLQIEDKIDELRQSGTPGNLKRADRLEMQQIFGGKPPEAYVKAKGSLGMAREGLVQTYNLLSSGAKAYLPKDRAKLKQGFQKMNLAFADLMSRGANFTETEQAMISGVVGGDPTDVIDRVLRGDESFIELLQNTAGTIESRGQALLDSYTKPRIKDFPYPWKNAGGLPEGVTQAEWNAMPEQDRALFK